LIWIKFDFQFWCVPTLKATVVGVTKYSQLEKLLKIDGEDEKEHFIKTNVACAIGPSVTAYSTDFSFQNLVFWIYLNFQRQKSPKIQYLPRSVSKSYQMNSIRYCSSRSFQQHQRHIPIPLKFSAMIKFNFQQRNHSIFKNFCTRSPNIIEPSPYTPPCRELSKDTKNTVWSIPVQWIS
jgi:hypothetical protein